MPSHSIVSLCNPKSYSLTGCSVLGDSPGKITRVGCHALLQGICPIQGSNPGLPHYRQILYHLIYQGTPRILEWVAYPFSRGSSQSRSETRVFCIAGRFFTSWATMEAHMLYIIHVCVCVCVCVCVYSHHLSTEFPISPHVCQHLSFSVWGIIVVLMDVKCTLLWLGFAFLWWLLFLNLSLSAYWPSVYLL